MRAHLPSEYPFDSCSYGRGLIPPLVFTRCVLSRMYGYQESRNAIGKNKISTRRSTMSCSSAYATPRLCQMGPPSLRSISVSKSVLFGTNSTSGIPSDSVGFIRAHKEWVFGTPEMLRKLSVDCRLPESCDSAKDFAGKLLVDNGHAPRDVSIHAPERGRGALNFSQLMAPSGDSSHCEHPIYARSWRGLQKY
jgi:hypothetical protein